MRVYEVNVKSENFLGRDRWLIQADDLPFAVEKARKKIKRNPASMKDWRIVSVAEVGELTA